MKPAVTWFRNRHEHSLHYAKFGLMQLARAGEITFREIAIQHSGDLLPEVFRTYDYARGVTVNVEEGRARRLLYLDGQDSIFQLSPLLREVDLYFTCTYHRPFFEGQPFSLGFPWQTECELSHYRQLYATLQTQYAPFLSRVRPFLPIGPGMTMAEDRSWLGQKLHNLRWRWSQRKAPWVEWCFQFARFQKRWEQLRQLRQEEPQLDIALRDSLWGWPRHRVALHKKLSRLSNRFQIQAELHYRKPFDYEIGTHPAPVPADFPLKTNGGVTSDYETQLARSRLAVFATGFHFGCRSIMTLAWLLGLKTYLDPLIFESTFPFAELEPDFNESGDWSTLEASLEAAQQETSSDRQRRQQIFDRVASPHVGASYLIEESLREA